MGLSFTIAAGPRQCSHSQVRVPLDSWPHFTVSDSRLPQPGGPGPRIYIPQEQVGPVILLGTGFPFLPLLPLAGPRWIYSTPPPHGILILAAWGHRYIASGRIHGKHRFPYCCVLIRCCGDVFTAQFRSGEDPQRTPLATLLLLLRDVTSQSTWRVPLLRVYGPLPSNGCFSASTFLALSKYATIIIRL
jgi:hypothetical protein